MRTHLSLGVAGMLCVAGTFLLSGDPDTTAAPTRGPAWGHLILQVEGDARALRITHVTPKESGYNPVRGEASHTIVVRDTQGSVLGSYPLDLSRFDLDPARIGRPLQVQGCEVRDTRVAALCSVPFLAAAHRFEIRRNDVILGSLENADYRALVEEGGK